MSEELIKLALKELQCTQKQLAEKIKASPTQITKWKQGEYISSDMEQKIKNLLNLDELDPKVVLMSGSIENAKKWHELIIFLADWVQDGAETDYRTLPLMDELGTLSFRWSCWGRSSRHCSGGSLFPCILSFIII